MTTVNTGVCVLRRTDVERLLDMPSCIDAVEAAFRQRGTGGTAPSAILGLHVANGGFHVKAATLNVGGRLLFAAKINANFPANPSRHGLPTIQGMVGLFDADCGVPIALMDSMSLTTIRTAAATAVAAKHLSRPASATLAVIGCGIQGRAHVRAIRAVRPITRVLAFDTHAATARRFADDVAREHGIAALACGDLNAATSIADVIVTCTPSRSPFLSTADARPGTFVGAVGADNEHKHEIDPALMAEATVVVDDLDQCATIGDLHHAIAAGTMTATDVRATLAAVVADPARWRPADDEIVVFDSTGVAIEDVAAAAVVLKRAEQDNDGLLLSLGD